MRDILLSPLLLRVSREVGPALVRSLNAGITVLPAKFIHPQNTCDLKIDPVRVPEVVEILKNMSQDPTCRSSTFPKYWVSQGA
jgi:hypothetical protein